MSKPILGFVHRRMGQAVRVMAVMILSLVSGLISQGLRAQVLETVVLSGDPAPGFESQSGNFFSFNPAAISESGHVVFTGFVATNPGFPSAIYCWDAADGLSLVAKQGMQAASNGDVDIFAFGGVIIDDQGRVAFQAQLTVVGEPLPVNALLFWEDDVLTLLVKDGEPETVDGTNASTGDPIVVAGTFQLITGPWDFAFNGGEVAFIAGLDTNPGLGRGIWLADAAATCVGANQCTNLANSFQNAPGAPPPPATPRFQDFLEVVRSSAGITGAVTGLTTGDQQFAFYRWSGANSPEFVARGNTPFVNGILQLAMGTAGSLGFRGGFGSAAPFDGDDSKAGVFANLRQVYQQKTTPAPGVIAQSGDPAPRLGAATSHAQTSNGNSVFAAKIWQIDGGPAGALHDQNGVWRETSPGSIDLLAYEGQDLPAARMSPRGTSDGLPSPTFDALFGGHVNRQGQVSIWAKKQGTGINPTNDEGLFAIQGNGEFGEVLSTGNVVVLEDLQAKTVTGFFPLGAFSQADTFVTGPGTEGRATALNGSGDLAMALDFLDGSKGVFVLPLGELMVIDPPKLVALEVTQVIQDWENSVALTKDKKTIVRAHLESLQDVLIAPILRGFRNEVELPESPLVPANTGLLVPTIPDAVAVRSDLTKNPYFELPKSWTEGTLRVDLELEGVGIDCQETAGPNPNDCSATVSFSPVDEPEIRFVRIYVRENGEFKGPSNYWLDDMAKRLISAYPISTLDWNIGSLKWFGDELPSTRDINKELRVLRASEKCTAAAGCKRLYYGVLLADGVDGLAESPGTIGSGRVPRSKLAIGRHTHTHEIGHNFGRDHAGNSTYGIWEDASGTEFVLGACCSTTDLTSDDYIPIEDVGASATTACSLEDDELTIVMTNGTRPTLGELDEGEEKKIYGMDTLLDRAVDPTQFFDVMSYCSQPGLDHWIGKQTYDALRVAINNVFDPAGVEPRLVDGIELDYLAIGGDADLATGEVVLDRIIKILGVNAPENPPTGSYTLRLRDGGGSEIQAIPFEPQRYPGKGQPPSTVAPFLIFVPDNPVIRQIEVENETEVAAMLQASLTPPTVTVTSPNGGETLDTSTLEISWDGNDLDGDSLAYMVQFSSDNGDSWTTLVTDWTEEALTIDRFDLSKSSQGVIRVVASDGFDTVVDVSDGLFIVANNPPDVAISAPVVNPLFSGAQQIVFEATGIDPEDGLIDGGGLAWSSDQDGNLGTGNGLSIAADTLAAGQHTITATVTDSDGGEGSSQIEIYIDIEGALFFDGFEANLGAWSSVQD